ncbi:MAG: ferrochelatase [Rhodobiaceae bacterium]|nr:MAG: ferrochelatase [Rhodobiaceae bacterium]
MSKPHKIAVVLLNLGGPDGPDAVKPFLFNLFSDPAIIQMPNPFRWLVAKIISSRRAPIARQIYAQIGGRSPIVAETQRQAEALEQVLQDLGEVRCFLAMRYWHPFSSEAAASVAGFAPDLVVLLPLYPQFSSTTTGSSLKAWFKAWGKQVGPGHTSLKSLEYREIFGYPVAAGWVEAQVELIRSSLQTAGNGGETRLLFSAHGLPKKIIEGGDPYQAQIEQSCAAIVEQLGIPGLDWVTCYQSRVGPMEWIGPSTEQEIERAGRDGKKVVIAPIAFVSDHSETLVELDIEYRELSEQVGVPTYVRVPTVGTHPAFIGALSQLVRDAL